MLHQNTVLIESCRDNNGERTVLRSSMEPYATELPHVHTRFTESFYVETGTLDLWNGFGKVHLELAQAMSIEPLTPHHYVAGKSGAIITITLEPGNAGVEHALRIMQGLERDAAYSSFGTGADDAPLLKAVLDELSDCHVSPDELKDRMEASPGEVEKVHALKKALLAQYSV